MISSEEFSAAYGKWYRPLVRFLTSRGISRDAAEDIAQAAWGKGWERRNQLKNLAAINVWIISIALNIYREGLRRPQEAVADLRDVATKPVNGLVAIDAQRIVRITNECHAWVLRMYYLEGMTVKEIAEETSLSETAIRIRLLRARVNAKKSLAQHCLVSAQRTARDIL